MARPHQLAIFDLREISKINFFNTILSNQQNIQSIINKHL